MFPLFQHSKPWSKWVPPLLQTLWYWSPRWGPGLRRGEPRLLADLCPKAFCTRGGFRFHGILGHILRRKTRIKIQSGNCDELNKPFLFFWVVAITLVCGCLWWIYHDISIVRWDYEPTNITEGHHIEQIIMCKWSMVQLHQNMFWGNDFHPRNMECPPLEFDDFDGIWGFSLSGFNATKYL